jgi:hypothetical protein
MLSKLLLLPSCGTLHFAHSGIMGEHMAKIQRSFPTDDIRIVRVAGREIRSAVFRQTVTKTISFTKK